MGVDGGRGKRKQKVMHFFHLQNNIINGKLRSYVLAQAPPSIKTRSNQPHPWLDHYTCITKGEEEVVRGEKEEKGGGMWKMRDEKK